MKKEEAKQEAKWTFDEFSYEPEDTFQMAVEFGIANNKGCPESERDNRIEVDIAAFQEGVLKERERAIKEESQWIETAIAELESKLELRGERGDHDLYGQGINAGLKIAIKSLKNLPKKP